MFTICNLKTVPRQGFEKEKDTLKDNEIWCVQVMSDTLYLRVEHHHKVIITNRKDISFFEVVEINTIIYFL